MALPDFGDRKIGLALGGGGARGFAHVGVLKVLQEEGIPFNIITGTSMGAMIGALYAQTHSAQAAIERLRSVLETQGSATRLMNIYLTDKKGDHFLDILAQRLQRGIVVNLSIMRKSLLSPNRIEVAIAELIEEGLIEDLPFKLGIVASDLISGKGIILSSGPIREAVTASSSIPGFFPPVPWGDLLLVDGEVTDLIPVEACRTLGADFVIAVNVNRDLSILQDMEHIIDIFLRSVRITNHKLTDMALRSADFVLHPITEDIQWSEFYRMDELIRAGEEAARHNLPAIIARLSAEENRQTSHLHEKGFVHYLSSEDYPFMPQ